MSAWEWVRVVGIVGPIGVMLIVGLVVAARSGGGRTAASGGTRRLMENLTRTAIVVAGSLVGLAVVHQLVGLRIPAIW